MTNDHYPTGSVRALLQTDLVKPNTQAVLKDRFQKEKRIVPVFLMLKILKSLPQFACVSFHNMIVQR